MADTRSGPERSSAAVAEEDPRELTRRGFLNRILGGAAAGTLAGAGLGAWAGTAVADEGHEDGSDEAVRGPEEGPTSTRVRRWAMVVDLRRCDGCVENGTPPQCTQYCNWGRYVPEGQQWVEVVEQPHDDPPGALPHTMPLPCFQCENAPCVNVCPVGATFHTPEGTVLIDQERCIGCRLCIAACPYDRRFFNWGDPVQPDWVRDSPYDVRTQTPAMRGTVMKCDFCTERLEAGGLPFCADGCPWGALYFGDLEEDIATNSREIVKLSRLIHEQGAFRFKEELGTEPRVWFIPGSGEAVPRTHHREFLKDRLEWPWREWDEATLSPVGGEPSGNGRDEGTGGGDHG